MPEWGTQPANHYLPRRKTEMRGHAEQLAARRQSAQDRRQAAEAAASDSPSLDDTTSLVGTSAPSVHPAFSVIFLTTLIGAGQGLFLALYAVEIARALRHRRRADAGPRFFVAGALVAAVLSRSAGSSPRSSIWAVPSARGARRRSGARRGCRAR